MIVTIHDENNRLRSKSEKVKSVKSVKPVLKRLQKEVARTPDAFGVAAPQIGENIRAVAFNVKGLPKVMVNPVIVSDGGDKEEFPEACLSIPGQEYKVKRPDTVIVEYMKANGKPSKKTLRGILSRIIQHEIDHFDGVLIDEKGEWVDPEKEVRGE